MKQMHRLMVTSETYKLASASVRQRRQPIENRSGQRLSLALPSAAARSRADLGFPLHAAGNWIFPSVARPSTSTLGRENGGGAGQALPLRRP